MDSLHIQNKIADHEIEMENIEANNSFKTCCNTTSDKRLLVFISSLSLSGLVLIFSCVQLTRLEDCNSQQTYVGLLTLILGLWLKSPIS